MRWLTRWVLIGILIVSCGDDGIGPERQGSGSGAPEHCGRPGSQLLVYPDSLRLVVGSADHVWLDWGCSGPPTNGVLDWTIRDPAIASLESGNPGPSSAYDPAIIHSQTPGRTVVVVQAAGLTDSVVVVVPDTVVMGPVGFVAAGRDVSCAVTEGGTAYCWGTGRESILGEAWVDPAIGTCWGSPCSPMPVRRQSDVSSVYATNSHACSLDVSGSAWCWGDNYSYQLGVADPRPFYDPVPVSGGRTFSTLAVGWAYTCGLTSDGDAYCWGDNHGGKLGTNQRVRPTATPALVAGDLDWVSLDAIGESTCGVTDAGHLYCWGLFDVLILPAGTEICTTAGGKDGPVSVACSYVPLRMSLDTGSNADSLLVQVSGSCARTSMGSVYCLDRPSGTYTPVVGLDPVVSISGGDAHNCGLTAGGSAFCWGSNGEGQLGDGTIAYSVAPVAVTGGLTFGQVAVGSSHTCGLTDQREVWCWGANHYGQAGASILRNPQTPVKVHGQD